MATLDQHTIDLTHRMNGKFKVQIGDHYCEAKRSPLDDSMFIVTAPEGHVFTGFMSKTVMVNQLDHRVPAQGTSLYGLSLIPIGCYTGYAV